MTFDPAVLQRRCAIVLGAAVLCLARADAQPAPTPPTPPPIIPRQSEADKGPASPGETRPEELPAKPPAGAPPAEPQLDTPLFPEFLPGERPPNLQRRLPPRERKVPLLEQGTALSTPAAEDEKPPVLESARPVLDPAQVQIQRTAMDQAMSTGEAILGDLTGLRGELDSPFLPTGRRGVPAFRIGPVDLFPNVTVGVSATRSEGSINSVDAANRLRVDPAGSPVGIPDGGDQSGSGESGEVTEEVEPFYQAGFSAVLRNQGHFSASLNYTIGRSAQSGGQSGGNSQSGQDREIDQQLSLGGSFLLPPIPRIQFGFGLAFTSLSGTNRDVGGSAERDLATLSLSASYDYTQKTSFSWDVSLPIRQFTGGVSSSGATTTFSVRNQVTKKTNVGLVITAGTLSTEVLDDPGEILDGTSGDNEPTNQPEDEGDSGDQDGRQPLEKGQEGTKQIYQRLMLSLNTSPTPLFSFNGSGGVEVRTAGGSTSASPTFGFGATWKPTIATTVNLAAESRIFSSATELDTNYTSTSVNLTVSQRIGYRLTATLTMGYEHAVYESIGENQDANSTDPDQNAASTTPPSQGGVNGEGGRVDDLYRVSLGLSMPITQRWNCGLTISAYKNESNFMPFESYQAILQTSYSF